MNFKFKKPSRETQFAMSKVASGEDTIEYHNIAEDKLSNLTNHSHVKLVNSGNAAIMTAMNSIDGTILIPDQGAWNGFKQIAKFLNKDLRIIKTNHGLIEIDSLQEELNLLINDGVDFKDENNKSALFLTSFAAYTAEQNIKEISKFLNENNILLVEDASGAISDYKKQLANGNYSDIIIGSTGSPKILNIGDGGFITTNNKEIFEKSNILLKTVKTSNISACGISNELDFASENLKTTMGFCLNLKEKIENETNFEVFHKNKRGINVILKSNDSKSLSYKLRQEFSLDSHGMITKCPNYNRIKEKGVALEIKNLDISCLNRENLNNIIDILNKY